MKKVICGILGMGLSLGAFSAQAEIWKKVLECDGGAVRVDNLFQENRSFQGMTAQVVVTNPDIVRYFVMDGGLQSNPSGEVVVRAKAFNGNLDPSARVFSFKTQENGWVVYDESEGNLVVNLGSYRRGVNWLFHNCVKK